MTTEIVRRAVGKFLTEVSGVPTRDALVEALATGFAAANGTVWERGKRDAANRWMGTTCVAAMVRDDLAIVGNAGDSRVYILRNSMLVQITHDHVMICDANAIADRESHERDRHFQRTITRATGLAAVLEPDITLVHLQAGDRLLLCTDGLYNVVDNREVERLLTVEDDPHLTCDNRACYVNGELCGLEPRLAMDL